MSNDHESGNGRPSTIASSNVRVALIIAFQIAQAVFFVWFGVHLSGQISGRVIDNQKIIMEQQNQVLKLLSGPDHFAKDLDRQMQNFGLRMEIIEDRLKAKK